MSQCFVSIDGTDSPIVEPSPFSPIRFSHKTYRSPVPYEIAVTVQSERIVWASRPWPVGSYTGIKIFRQGLHSQLGSYEFAIANSGYVDIRTITPLPSEHPKARTYAIIRAQHETASGRLKKMAQKVLFRSSQLDLSAN